MDGELVRIAVEQLRREELWEAFAELKKATAAADDLAREAAKLRVLQILRDHWDISVTHEITAGREVFGWGGRTTGGKGHATLLDCLQDAVMYAIWVRPVTPIWKHELPDYQGKLPPQLTLDSKDGG